MPCVDDFSFLTFSFQVVHADTGDTLYPLDNFVRLWWRDVSFCAYHAGDDAGEGLISHLSLFCFGWLMNNNFIPFLIFT